LSSPGEHQENYAHHCFADNLKHLHDLRLVRPLEVPQRRSLKVILASWGITFFEYCFQVPANRIGSYEFNAAQLKTIQEVITLTVFAAFSVTYLGEKLKWNYAARAVCLVLGVFFRFHKW
jgi:uncharacterized protein (DUF486 family)